jgi:hypothetical protein
MAQQQMIEKLPDNINLDEIREMWIKIGICTDPDDVAGANQGVDLAYDAANLARPAIRIWLDSPLAGAMGAALLAGFDENAPKKKPNKKSKPRAEPASERDAMMLKVARIVADGLGVDCDATFPDDVLAQACVKVNEQISNCGYGLHDAGWLSFYWVFRELLPCTSKLEGLWKIAMSTGWWWPFTGAVIFTKRPCEIHMNAENRLHRDGGPALAYPDGFSIYRLNGVAVPKWLACDSAEKIDPLEFMNITNAEQRREFVRKIGMDRIVYKTQPKVLDKDGNYELLDFRMEDGRSRPYLRMQNPSIDTWHVEGVPPNTRTVQEALNFRNGLTKDKIDDKNGTEWYQQGDLTLWPEGAKKFRSRPTILT